MIHLEPAKLSDKPRIIEILSEYNMGNFGHAERNAMPKIEHFTVAKVDSRIVGCAAFLLDGESKLTINNRQAETGSLAVIPECRGKGVGYQLQIARMKRLVAMGVEQLFTETDTPQNINWYCRKFGYKKLHTRRKESDFGDPAIDTFTLLEADLKKWRDQRNLKRLIDSRDDLDVDWFAEEGFGDLSEIRPVLDQKLIITAAITGMVPRKADSPHVPITPEEIIADAEVCFNAGAAVLHLHARDGEENPTYKAEAYKEFVPEIRRRCPGVIINITTSGRDFNTFEARSEVLNLTSDSRPDMASLTLGSNNFPKQASVNSPEMIQGLAQKMLREAVKPELEIFETGMINYGKYLSKKGWLKPPFYFNFLLGSLGTIPARLIDLDHLIATLPENAAWGATGVGGFQLPINLAAIIKGGHVRVGLEDNLYFDSNRTRLATNEQLVKRLASFAKEIGREISSPEETRRTLNLH